MYTSPSLRTTTQNNRICIYEKTQSALMKTKFALMLENAREIRPHIGKRPRNPPSYWKTPAKFALILENAREIRPHVGKRP